MKRNYMSPGIHVEYFAANEYIAACEYIVTLVGCDGNPIHLHINSEPQPHMWTTGTIAESGSAPNVYPTDDGTWIVCGSINDSYHSGTGLMTGEWQVKGAESVPGVETCTIESHINAPSYQAYSEYATHHHFTYKNVKVSS